MQQLKIVIIGPVKSGKTTISNFLAEATEIPYDYHPTQGTRILEFEIQNINVNNRYEKRDIELWDCSGDRKFAKCWPAIRKGVHGVILVYSNNSNDCLKEIQQFYEYFVKQPNVGPDRSAIFYYDPEQKNFGMPKVISSTYVNVSHVKCNTESGGNKLKADFSSFISTILNKMHSPLNREGNYATKGNIT